MTGLIAIGSIGIAGVTRSGIEAPEAAPTASTFGARLDLDLFRRRWEPVDKLPPAVIIVREPAKAEPQREQPRVAKVEPTHQPPTSEDEGVWPRPPPRPRSTPPPARSRYALSNICTRHGLRKHVTNGGRSWRCRR
jgi:hypothetical protein